MQSPQHVQARNQVYALFKELEGSFRATDAERAQLRPALETVTFEGGGFRTISYLGWVLRRRCEGRLNSSTAYYGTSLGAVYAASAALLLSNFDAFAAMAADLIAYCADVVDDWWLHFGTCLSRFRRSMEKHFPNDISLAQGRCHICITRFSAVGLPAKLLVSSFRDKQDLIDAISASMFIPVWAVGVKRPWNHFRGKLAIDGGIVDNTPLPREIDKNTHETVVDSSAPWMQVLVPPKSPPKHQQETPGLAGSLADIRRGFLNAPPEEPGLGRGDRLMASRSRM